MRKINWIVLHCTATPQNTTVQSILNYWKNTMGWSRPGYHHLISPDGTVHDLVPIEQLSNGVAGYNAGSIHISYIGGVDAKGKAIDNRTCEQKEAQIALLNEYSKRFPDAIIQGHRDFSPDKNRDGVISEGEWLKTCPSFSVKEWLSTINFKSSLPSILLKTTADVNIREGAGTAFKTVSDPIKAGTVVKKIGGVRDWTFVSVEKGVKGWIFSKYLV